MSDSEEFGEVREDSVLKATRVIQILIKFTIAAGILSTGFWIVSSWIFAAKYRDAVLVNFIEKIASDFIEFVVPSAMVLATLVAGTSVIKSIFNYRVKPLGKGLGEGDEPSDLYISEELRADLMVARVERELRLKRLMDEGGVEVPEYGPFRPEPSELDHIRSRSGLAEETALLFTAMRVRLMKDEVRLRGNSRLNLMIGVFVALIAASIIGAPLFMSRSVPSSVSEFWPAYILRLPVGLLLQIVSFFFLRLYVSTENEIKHNKNEVTNVESKFLSLIASREFGYTPELAIRSLAETERNFVIRKGDKTVGSENDSRYNDMREILDELLDVIPSAYLGVKPNSAAK